MEDGSEPPGTEVDFAEDDTQPLSQEAITDGSIPAFQEIGSPEQDGTDPNSSFERPPPEEQRQRRSRSRRDRSSRHSKSHRKHHSSRHSKRSAREEVVYHDDYLYSGREERETSRTKVSYERETEEGEILEDGEIASDEGEETTQQAVNIRRSFEDDDEGKCL